MATTIVPDPRPLREGNDWEAFLGMIHDQLKISQGDQDKAGSMDDHSYYTGQLDILQWVEDMITVKKEEPPEKHRV